MQNSGGKIKTIIGDNVLYLSARFYAIVLFTTYSSSPWNFQSDQSHDQRDPITFALERCSIPLATSRANLISWPGGKASSSESDFPRAVRRKLRRSPRGRYSKATYNTSKDMKWDITKTNKQTNKNKTKQKQNKQKTSVFKRGMGCQWKLYLPIVVPLCCKISKVE